MKVLKFEYGTDSGVVYCIFFMCWLGSAYDYPMEARKSLSHWRDGQPVWASIKGPSRCEATA